MISLASGVVQGSVIGPLLFLLFINDVGDLLCGDRCTCKLYADDVKLYTTLCVNDDIAHMQNRLNVLVQDMAAKHTYVQMCHYAHSCGYRVF